MTTTVNDGGPAFPRPMVGSDQAGTVDAGCEGMTLRDWFAGQALMGLCADYGRTTCAAEGVHENLAMVAHRIADAMLKEREKGSEE